MKSGAPVVPVTTKTQHGLDGVRGFLGYGRTVALLGSSGAGKSTIINGLLGEERMPTNAVRESDGRGRHTTSRRELIPLAVGGAVIDTPGMRELQLWAGEESVERTFDEITEIASTCRFGNCSHSDERGCAVAKAIAEGTLSPERWNSYRKLMAEARRHEETTNLVARAKRKKRQKLCIEPCAPFIGRESENGFLSLARGLPGKTQKSGLLGSAPVFQLPLPSS